MSQKKGNKKPPQKNAIEDVKANFKKPAPESPRKETRGRGSNSLLDGHKFQPIEDYVEANRVDDPLDFVEQEAASSPAADPTPAPVADAPKATTEAVQQAINETVLIEVNPENLALADAFFTGIAEKMLKRMGLGFELNPMTEKDLEIWAKLCPPVELERSWKNFFIFFLIAKAK